MTEGRETNDGKRDSAQANNAGTASGLREDQIAKEDLDKLHTAFRLRRLIGQDSDDLAQQPAGWIAPGLAGTQVHAVELAITEPLSSRIRIAPLPRKVRTRRMKMLGIDCRLRRDLHLMLSQPVQRKRMLMGELSKEQEFTLHRKLYGHYGKVAESMVVAAVFANVPPEAVKTCRLTSDLRSMSFTFPTDVSPRSAVGGHYLIVLRCQDGETRHVLFRLDE